MPHLVFFVGPMMYNNIAEGVIFSLTLPQVGQSKIEIITELGREIKRQGTGKQDTRKWDTRK